MYREIIPDDESREALEQQARFGNISLLKSVAIVREQKIITECLKQYRAGTLTPEKALLTFAEIYATRRALADVDINTAPKE